MKKAIVITALCLSFILGTAFAAAVRDWHDLGKARDHVHQAIDEMNHARAANNYDMAGHGVKAEQSCGTPSAKSPSRSKRRNRRDRSATQGPMQPFDPFTFEWARKNPGALSPVTRD